MTDITMPRLSDSMEQGTILKWLIDDGQPVAAGEDLVEIETDKAAMTYAAEAEGVLTVVAAEGTTHPVGAVIAHVGASVAAVGEEAAEPAPQAPAPEAPAPAPAPGPAPAPAPAVAEPASSEDNGAVTATPIARRVARAHHISLDDVAGTGPRGRITRADVLAAAGVEMPAPRPVAPAVPVPAAPAAPAAAAPVAPAPAPAAAAGAKGDVTVEELTRMQSVIARRMAESKATVPHFQVQTEVVMDAALAFRGELKRSSGDLPAPSVNDLIVKACAIALRSHPRANGSYRDGRFELHARVNVGVAVAADEALVVPVVTDADSKSLGQIARDTRALAERVRAGTITPPELSGGTFTVSNLGMFGMTAITPVVNMPQAAILGVGAARDVLARVDGEIVDRKVMTLTLSCDHRILYGADAARFLAAIKDALESPLRLAL